MASLVTQSVGPASSALLPATPNPIPARIANVVPTQALQADVSRAAAQKTATDTAPNSKEKAIQRESRSESPFGSEERPAQEGGEKSPSGRVSIKA
jgi:hypothetical protein